RRLRGPAIAANGCVSTRVRSTDPARAFARPMNVRRESVTLFVYAFCLRFLFAFHRDFIEIADLARQLRDPAGERLNGGDRIGRGKLDRAKPRRDRDHLQAPGPDLVAIAARRQQRDPQPRPRERGRDPKTLASIDAPAMGSAGAKPLLDRTVVIGLAGECDHRPAL